MQFSEYQKKSRETAIYPDIGKNFVYPTLGLAGEVGEIAEKVKKIIRDAGGVVSTEKRLEIAKEAGDCIWYWAQLCSEFGLDCDEVARDNLAKLASRKARGVLHGSGDNR